MRISRRSYYIFIFFTLLLAQKVFAQNVTTSFDRTMLATNPSAATTRGLAQVSISQTYKDVKSSMTDPTDLTATSRKVKEDIKLNTTELRFTGGHARLIPEVYLGYNKAIKKASVDGVDSPDVKMNYIDSLINFGYKYSQRMGIGLQVYFPHFDFDASHSEKTQNGTKFKLKNIYSQQNFGASFGSTVLLGRNLYAGAFANIDQEQRRFDVSYLDYLSSQNTSDQATQKNTVNRFGGGVSYLNGDSRKHGFRAELAYSMMKVPKDKNAIAASTSSNMGVEVKGALEFAWRGISFGGTMRMIKNGYYDRSDLIQKNFFETPPTPNFTSSFGGFIALSSDRGHSFGLSGYSLPSTGKRKYFGQDLDSKSTTTLININYAYLF
jgi:hypothetical protein